MKERAAVTCKKKKKCSWNSAAAVQQSFPIWVIFTTQQTCRGSNLCQNWFFIYCYLFSLHTFHIVETGCMTELGCCPLFDAGQRCRAAVWHLPSGLWIKCVECNIYWSAVIMPQGQTGSLQTTEKSDIKYKCGVPSFVCAFTLSHFNAIQQLNKPCMKVTWREINVQ